MENGILEKIGILTYPVKHRKTFDLLSLLRANGYVDVMVYAIPFHYQKKKFPIYQHRPEMNYYIPDIKVLCENFGYKYEEGQLEDFAIEEERVILISGAGILPESFIERYTVINAHPGYIPNCRGLDAFKWAIIEKQPIGVTTHLVGEYVDAGLVIERREIPVYTSDTFHSLAQRVYENEVSMLVEAVGRMKNCSFEMMYPGNYEVHKRMPAKVEKDILQRFEEYKNKYGIKNILGNCETY